MSRELSFRTRRGPYYWCIELPGGVLLKSGGRVVSRLGRRAAIECADHQAGLAGQPYRVVLRRMRNL